MAHCEPQNTPPAPPGRRGVLLYRERVTDLTPSWYRPRTLHPLDTVEELSAALGEDPNFAATIAAELLARPTAAQVAATYQTLGQGLLAWTLAQAFTVVSATRDTNEAITTASVVWPDGATGTFTTDTASTAFPGAIDAYHVTHVLGGVTKTVTQPAVTRDAGGAVTAQPALTVA